MAEVQDFEDTSAEIGEIEAVEKQKDEPEVNVEHKQPEESEIDPKYRGKTISDVVKMHQEAEKLMARQAAEVGEVRKLADELLKSQLQKKPEPEPPKEIDFFENPQEAIRQAVENNPRVLAAEQYARHVQMEQARAKLSQMHPDFADVVQSTDFAGWIKASRVRQQLFQQAENYDIEAADELLSTFKALKGPKQVQVPEAEKKARESSLKVAAVETGGTGESSKKVYRRADLIRLKLTNPTKFDAMQDVIDAAYREGRVK